MAARGNMPRTFALALSVLLIAPIRAADETQYSVKAYPTVPGAGDVEAALEQPVSIDGSPMPLAAWLAAWSSQSGVLLSINDPLEARLAVAVDTPVSLGLDNVSARSALRLVLDDFGLGYKIDGDQVRVVSAASLWSDLSTRVYRVALPTAEQDLQKLIAVIVEPDNWDFVGGMGTMTALEKTLIVSTTDPVHHEIEQLLCAVAQIANSDAEGSAIFLADTPPQKRRELEEALERASGVRAENYPLRHLISEVATASGIPIVVDRRALDNLGINPNEVVNVPSAGLTARQVLESVHPDLLPVIRSEAVLLTSADAVRGNLRTAVFDVSDLAVNEAPKSYLLAANSRPAEDLGWHVENLGRLVTSMIEPSNWGSVGGRWSIMAVAEPRCLVVSSTDRGLEKVSELLGGLRASGAPAAGKPSGRDSELPGGYSRAIIETADGEEASQLRNVISKLVQPQSWSFDPDAGIEVAGRLVILQNRSGVLEQAIELSEHIQRAKRAGRKMLGVGN